MVSSLRRNRTRGHIQADFLVYGCLCSQCHQNPRNFVAADDVAQMLHYFYHVAFAAGVTPTNLIIGDGHAVWEGTFHGKHIGEFAGIPATGKEVRVPLCVVYDIEDEQITRGRIYFEMPALVAQLDVP